MPKSKKQKPNLAGIVPQIPMGNVMKANKSMVMPMSKSKSKGKKKKC